MIKYLNVFQKFLILLFPLAIISGPLIPEIIVFLLITTYIYTTKKSEIYNDFLNKVFLYFLLFYFFIIFTSLINQASSKSIINSFFFIRFPIFSIIVYKLIRFDETVQKRLLYVLAISFIFLILDSTIQIGFKKNIFGLELIANRPSSLFGDELILGSYLIKFSTILFGLLLLFYNKINKLLFLIIPLTLFGILISGERTAFITTMELLIFLISILKFYKKKYFIISLIFWLVLSFSFQNIQDRYYEDIRKKFLKYNDIYFPYEYSGLILSSLEQFKNNPIIGGGVRSFRVNSKETLLNFKLNNEKVSLLRRMILEKLIKDGKCSTHPHNVFLEFASELGLIFIIFLLFKITYIFYLLFQKLFENKKNYSYSNVANIIFILSPILIIFPFLPSGSFFNNWNLSIYFFNLAFFTHAIHGKEL